MDNLDKLVNSAFEDLKGEIKTEHETYFKGVLKSKLYEALFSSLEEYDKMLDKVDKRRK